ncbi:helix-turn-helix domain-containing protein (plasmid) [Exiguobacterium sp. Helios]|uniref:helix-turn-helix domain-containing protein n=1 Tax=Exiguobacterium sp. Helios TaxID=2735868 RepID=UPI00165D7AE9|nr:helix-turn-helix domain-containing protein [Exiguobacterium sp. Helios]QNR22483.1 helix-turn-helix domain-containing protein [Exiguobacterium sp. Helios]
MLKDKIQNIIGSDLQIDKIEESSEFKSESLKEYASILRAINVLIEHEKVLKSESPELSEEAYKLIVTKYTIPSNAFDVLPKYLTVNEVSTLLSITPQMVRRKCQAKEINAYRTLNNKGKWRIPTEQFVDHPELETLIINYKKRRRSTEKTVSTLDSYFTNLGTSENND